MKTSSRDEFFSILGECIYRGERRNLIGGEMVMRIAIRVVSVLNRNRWIGRLSTVENVC